MNDRIWFMELKDLDLEDLVQLKLYIRQGILPEDPWHEKPNPDNPEGVTMDEWLEVLEKEFVRLGI